MDLAQSIRGIIARRSWMIRVRVIFKPYLWGCNAVYRGPRHKVFSLFNRSSRPHDLAKAVRPRAGERATITRLLAVFPLHGKPRNLFKEYQDGTKGARQKSSKIVHEKLRWRPNMAFPCHAGRAGKQHIASLGFEDLH